MRDEKRDGEKGLRFEAVGGLATSRYLYTSAEQRLHLFSGSQAVPLPSR